MLVEACYGDDERLAAAYRDAYPYDSKEEIDAQLKRHGIISHAPPEHS